ncbi:MAG: CBS domain-containing protein [Actinomycetia bacterium]|nr:CBS domain-containing protein [Actinomycetes bacterium]
MDGFLVGRVRGIDLRLNWSVMVIAGLVTWSLADGILPEEAPGRSTTTYWMVAALTAVAFFLALTAHEMGHSLVAIRYGVEVKSITLWLFGGVAQLGSSPSTAGSALQIAIAGPLVSVAIGVVALAVAVPFGGLVGFAMMWFGTMNVFLAVFNMLPAFPLDGGRVYQAWRWRRSGNRIEATDDAVRVGRLIGGLLVALGLLQAAAGVVLSGVWMMMIGWFLREAARAEGHQAHIEVPLRRYRVVDVMTADPLTVTPETTLTSFVAGRFMGGRHAAYPVTIEGQPVGLMTVDDIRGVPEERWSEVTVGRVASPMGELVTAAPDDQLIDLFNRFGRAGEHRALVIDDSGQLVGIVAPSDIARLVSSLELVTG